MSQEIRESILQFGEPEPGNEKRLLGILARPSQPDPTLPVIVIPNTGFEHRVGPNRLHVQISRALAAAGYYVLRFDLGGLGDSSPPVGHAASMVKDSQLAMDALDKLKLGRNYLFIGLCSGANDAHQTARVDERIVGMFCLDGHAFESPRFRQLRLKKRLLHPWRSLRNVIARWLPQFRAHQSMGSQGAEAEIIVWPSKQQVEADYQLFLDRQMHMAFFFTGDIQSVYLYAEQHYDVFPMLRGWAPVWFLPHIDHTLTRRAAREEMIAHIHKWLSSLKD